MTWGKYCKKWGGKDKGAKRVSKSGKKGGRRTEEGDVEGRGGEKKGLAKKSWEQSSGLRANLE